MEFSGKSKYFQRFFIESLDLIPDYLGEKEKKYGIMSLAESCVYAEDSIRRKTHGDGSRRGIMFA